MKNGFYQNINGYKAWLKNNEFYRPYAVTEIYHGNRYYYGEYVYDQTYHRLDGPAIIYRDNTLAWVINYNDITFELMNYCTNNNIDIHDYKNLSKSDRLKLKIKFGLQL